MQNFLVSAINEGNPARAASVSKVTQQSFFVVCCRTNEEEPCRSTPSSTQTGRFVVSTVSAALKSALLCLFEKAGRHFFLVACFACVSEQRRALAFGTGEVARLYERGDQCFASRARGEVRRDAELFHLV